MVRAVEFERVQAQAQRRLVADDDIGIEALPRPENCFAGAERAEKLGVVAANTESSETITGICAIAGRTNVHTAATPIASARKRKDEVTMRWCARAKGQAG